MRLDPSVRTRGDLIEPFRPAQIASQVPRNGSEALGLTGHLGNVGGSHVDDADYVRRGALLVDRDCRPARRPGGGARGRPPSLREKAVQRELKFSEDQSRKVAAFFDGLDASERDARQKFAQASPDERGRMMEEMRASSRKQLSAILTPEQFKRLEQIELQRAGFAALRSPKVQADLKLTADQKSRVEAIVGQAMGQIRQSGMELQGDPAAAKARREEIGKAALAQVVALLTPAQRATWTEMTGPPFDAPPEPPPARPAAGGSGGAPAARKAEMTRPAEDPRPRVAMPKRAPRRRPAAPPRTRPRAVSPGGWSGCRRRPSVANATDSSTSPRPAASWSGSASATSCGSAGPRSLGPARLPRRRAAGRRQAPRHAAQPGVEGHRQAGLRGRGHQDAHRADGRRLRAGLYEGRRGPSRPQRLLQIVLARGREGRQPARRLDRGQGPGRPARAIGEGSQRAGPDREGMRATAASTEFAR